MFKLERENDLCHHPTRWARNATAGKEKDISSLVTIPHGGLGTAKKRSLPSVPSPVTIPHGGLGTQSRRWCYEGSKRSPSHTVGSERGGLAMKHSQTTQSPSHTVGSERLYTNSLRYLLLSHHPTRWARNLIGS